MDWLGAAVGLGSALFGGKGGRGNPYQDALYAKWSEAIDAGLQLYRSTDFAALDRQTVENYRTHANEEANTLMENYDADLAAAGYNPEYTDSERQRTTGRFAYNASKSAAGLESSLAASRPLRQQALLPNPNAVAGGFDMASRLDSYQDNQRNAEFQALMQIARMIPRGGARAGGGGNASTGGGQSMVSVTGGNNNWLRNVVDVIGP